MPKLLLSPTCCGRRSDGQLNLAAEDMRIRGFLSRPEGLAAGRITQGSNPGDYNAPDATTENTRELLCHAPCAALRLAILEQLTHIGVAIALSSSWL